MSLGNLASAEVEADLVNSVGVNKSKVVIEGPLREQAVFACWMTELHAQP
jgi:hypothetical protein